MSIQNQLSNSSHVLKFTKRSISDPDKIINDFEIQLQEYEVPTFAISTAEGAAPKIAGFQIVGTAVEYTPLTVTALLDEDLKGWLEIYKWMKELVEPKKGNPVKFNDSVAQASLHILTNNRTTRQLIAEFRNIYPVELTGWVFANNQSDDVPPLTYNVTFQYESYSINDQGIKI